MSGEQVQCNYSVSPTHFWTRLSATDLSTWQTTSITPASSQARVILLAIALSYSCTQNFRDQIQICPNRDPPAIFLSDGHRLFNEDVEATSRKCDRRSHVILHIQNCFPFSFFPILFLMQRTYFLRSNKWQIQLPKPHDGPSIRNCFFFLLL